MFGWKSGVPWLGIILVTALTLRIAAALAVQHIVNRTPGRLCLVAGDAEGYWELAGTIIKGKGYAVHEPPRRVFRVPGFPLLLAAGMSIFGESPLALRLILAGIGTGACGLVYLLGMALFDRPTALWGCLLAAISPSFVGLSVLFLSETLFAAAMLLSLLALAKLVTATGESSGVPASKTCALAALAGASIGLASLVHPSWLLTAPAFAVVYLFRAQNRRRAVIESCVLAVGLALSMAPWVLRNAFVTGHFVATTLWAGPSLYDGLNEHATGASDMRFIEDDGIYQQRPEYDADRHYRQAALQFVRNHPGRAIELAGLKLARFWSLVPNASEFRQAALRYGIGAWTVPFMLLACWGGWLSRGRFWQWFLPAAPVLYFSAVHLAFVGSVRYRLPAEYPLCLLAAAGLMSLTRVLRNRAAHS